MLIPKRLIGTTLICLLPFATVTLAQNAPPVPGMAKSKTRKPAVKPGKPAPPASAPVVAPAPVPLPNPPVPVQQAQQLGMTSCTPVLNKMSQDVLTTHYDAQSGWYRADPPNHIFQSVAILNNPANVPQDGLAALVAAPLAGGCEGVSMQVFPLAGDCDSAEKVILKDGRNLGALINGRILLDARGKRLFLLPAFNHTCIAIAVDSTFNAP